jgi:predicted transposase/invertase (TIGR01784 family)
LEQAEIAKFDRKEQMTYQDNLKYYRDLKNSFDTYFEKGVEEGKKLGFEKGERQKAFKMAKTMKQADETIEKIMKYTGLSQNEIENYFKRKTYVFAYYEPLKFIFQ